MLDPTPFPLSERNFRRIVRELATDTTKIKIAFHAKERMTQRGITLTQVYACIRSGVKHEPVHMDIRGDYRCTLRRVHAGDDVHVAIALKSNGNGQWIAVVTVF